MSSQPAFVRRSPVQSSAGHLGDTEPDWKTVRNELRPSESKLGRFVNHRLTTDNDCQILITGSTGVGKTTFGIALAHDIDPSWTAKERGSVGDFSRYFEAYDTASPAQVAYLDELEGAADRRRAMSSDNVDLSQVLAQFRYKNVCSIFTAPLTTMIDNRIVAQVDVWVSIPYRGVAIPHFVIHVDNPENPYWYTRQMRSRGGNPEYIVFEDMPYDRDKAVLDEMKERGDGIQSIARYGEEDLDRAKSKGIDRARVQFAVRLLEHTDLNQTDIGRVVERDQSWVSKLNRGDLTDDIDEEFPIRD